MIAKFKLGRCYFELKEYKKSIKAFKNFLSQVQADSNEAAAKSLEKRSSFFITSVGVRVELAKPLEGKSQSDDAQLQAMIKISYYTVGISYARLGRYERGLWPLTRCIQIDPCDARYLMERGKAF